MSSDPMANEMNNIRRPSGISANGIPSPDEIIALGRNNVVVATILGHWKHGVINFDEALRLAVWHLADQNSQLASQVAKLNLLNPNSYRY